MRKSAFSLARTITLTSACMAITLTSEAASAEATLESTAFYRDKAQGCQAIERNKWPQPIVRAFEEAKATLKKVELCKGRYPVFTVAFNYDPDGPNDRYYDRIYRQVSEATGHRSYAIVDPNWGRVAEAEVEGNNISLSYESFSPSNN